MVSRDPVSDEMMCKSTQLLLGTKKEQGGVGNAAFGIMISDYC